MKIKELVEDIKKDSELQEKILKLLDERLEEDEELEHKGLPITMDGFGERENEYIIFRFKIGNVEFETYTDYDSWNGYDLEETDMRYNTRPVKLVYKKIQVTETLSAEEQEREVTAGK